MEFRHPRAFIPVPRPTSGTNFEIPAAADMVQPPFEIFARSKQRR